MNPISQESVDVVEFLDGLKESIGIKGAYRAKPGEANAVEVPCIIVFIDSPVLTGERGEDGFIRGGEAHFVIFCVSEQKAEQIDAIDQAFEIAYKAFTEIRNELDCHPQDLAFELVESSSDYSVVAFNISSEVVL